MRGRISLAVILLLAGCDSGVEERTHVSSTGVLMHPYEAVPEGSVPRGASAHAQALAASPPVTPQLIRHGAERFQAFCSPCHGRSGTGDGIVTTRGFPRPPSLQEPRLVEAPAAHVVEVITHGRGLMMSYADRIPPADRWALAHYVKALQTEGGEKGSRP